MSGSAGARALAEKCAKLKRDVKDLKTANVTLQGANLSLTNDLESVKTDNAILTRALEVGRSGGGLGGAAGRGGGGGGGGGKGGGGALPPPPSPLFLQVRVQDLGLLDVDGPVAAEHAAEVRAGLLYDLASKKEQAHALGLQVASLTQAAQESEARAMEIAKHVEATEAARATPRSCRRTPGPGRRRRWRVSPARCRGRSAPKSVPDPPRPPYGRPPQRR